ELVQGRRRRRRVGRRGADGERQGFQPSGRCMTPFSVAGTDAALDVLRARIRAYRFPNAPEDAGWRYGCDPAFLRALGAYWADGFDMRGAQACLNPYPQVTHRGEDIDLHAMHVVAEAGGRRPLLLTHGWPGSVF